MVSQSINQYTTFLVAGHQSRRSNGLKERTEEMCIQINFCKHCDNRKVNAIMEKEINTNIAAACVFLCIFVSYSFPEKNQTIKIKPKQQNYV